MSTCLDITVVLRDDPSYRLAKGSPVDNQRQLVILLAALGHYARSGAPRTEHFDDLPVGSDQAATGLEVDLLRETLATEGFSPSETKNALKDVLGFVDEAVQAGILNAHEVNDTDLFINARQLAN